MNAWIYSIISVTIVSLVSFSGALTLALKREKLKKFLIYFVSFSAGGLLGNAFIHLLPEVIEEYNNYVSLIFIYVVVGILTSFILEKVICWRHNHLPISRNHVRNFNWMNLWGDFFHNFIDGLTIAVSFLINIPTGIATTLAVIFHEIPQEIGDFGVLVYGGFRIKKALFLNFLTALSAVLGTLTGLFLNHQEENLILFFAPFAAGNFIYIASANLIPELHQETRVKKGVIQTITFLLGVGIMYGLSLFE